MSVAWWPLMRAAAVATVASRIMRTIWASPPVTVAPTSGPISVAVVIPARDEATRLAPAVAASLEADGVRDVVVVDDASTDGTADVALRSGARVIAARDRPVGWAGKTWAMHEGAASVDAEADACADWLLFVDADVRIDPALPAAMVSRAEADGLDLLAVAARSAVGPGGARWLQASMLATLVYRFGAPGTGGRVLSSGQCVLVRRSSFDEWGGLAPVADSWVEDVALARWLVDTGRRVAFLDACDLVEVAPYPSFTATWSGWGRSLGLPGVDSRARRVLDVVVLALAMPLPLVRVVVGRADVVDLGAVAMRLGTLVGTRRAFAVGGVAYWLSPLADVCSVASLVTSLVSRRRRWRGRDAN